MRILGVASLGVLGTVFVVACGGGTAQVRGDGTEAATTAETKKDGGKKQREQVTMRVVEAPKEPEYVDGVDRAAQDAFRRGVRAVSQTPPDYATARSAFEEATRRDPAFLEAWFNLGMLFERTGRPLEAVEVYQQALQKNPGNRDAKAAVGKVYLSLAKRAREARDTQKADRYESEAKRLFDEVISEDTDNVQANNALALYWLMRGDQKTAEDFVKKVLLLQPRNVVALNTRGLINLQAGRLSIARWVFEEKALREDPNSTEALTNLGVTYLKMGETPKAVASFEKALVVDPDNFEARMNLAAIYLEYLHYQAALEQYDAVIRLVPGEAEAWVGSGSCLLGLHQPKEAVERWKKALELNANLGPLYARIGKVYESSLNDLDQAIQYYDWYLERANPPANDPIRGRLPVLKEMKANGGIMMPPEPQEGTAPQGTQPEQGTQPAPAPAAPSAEPDAK